MATGSDIDKSDDYSLIKLYLGGNAGQFDILYERYKRQIYSYLNKMLPGQSAAADDLFQQTWIKIIRQLPRYENKQRFLAWAMRIAHNLAIDHFRKNGAHRRLRAGDGADRAE